MVLIAVHGSASRLLPAERGTVHLTVQLEDEDRAVVLQQVAALHDRLTVEAAAFAASGAATWWGSDQVWVRADHRFDSEGQAGRAVQTATARVHVRFRDFTALSTWLPEVGIEPGVGIDGIDWSITREHGRTVERELRVEAVGDAVTRAEAYAGAIGGSGVALQAVWEAGLRPTGESGGGWRAQATSALSGRGRGRDGIALRPEDIEIAAHVSADFLLEP